MSKRHMMNLEEYSLRSKQRFYQRRRGSSSSSDEGNDTVVAACAPLPAPPLEAAPEMPVDSDDNTDSFGESSNSDSSVSSDRSDIQCVHSDHDNDDCPDEPSDSDHAPSDSDSDDGGEPSDDSPDDSSSDSSDSDEDSDNEDGGNNRNDDPLLYVGAPITVSESMLSVLSLALAHNLSGTCLSDILELIAMHCPQPNSCPTSLYKFNKYFSTLKSPLVRRHYCSLCLNYLVNKDEVCGRCNAQNGVSYFLEIPITPQLQALYKRPGFLQKVQNHRNRRKQLIDNYEDLYDGSVFLDLHNNGNIVGHRNNISFTWNTDGVRIFKSSKSELWPFFLSLNELSFLERTKIDNMIIAGLWYGPKKPLPGLFLRFMRDEFQQIRRGIDVTLHDGTQMRVRGAVICGTLDLHAKALFLNTKLFNSRFGCQVCKIETVPHPLPTSLHRVYLFQRVLPLRTDEENIVFAQNARQQGRDCYGIKGPSALAPIVRRPIEFTCIDTMHQSWIGLSKRLGLIWFDKKYSDHAASLRNVLRLIDQRLCSITPPHYIQRMRSIAEHFKYWKAHELKAFLLIYSLPVLSDLMPNDFLDHHKLLVLGLSLLNMESIDEGMIETASRALTEYVARFEDLYGRFHMTNNLHSLLHLPLMVSKFGPNFITSCFNYENMNGVLKKLVTGTRHSDLQIYSAASMFLNLCAFKEERLPPGRRPYEFCKRLAEPKRRLPLTTFSDRWAVVGKYYHYANNLPALVQDALEDLGIQDGNFNLFYRLFNYKQKILFTSTSYTRLTKMNSACVKIDFHGRKRFGILHSFVRVTHCECREVCNCDAQFYAIVRTVTVTPAFRVLPGGVLPHIHKCTYRELHYAVEIDRLVDVCCLIRNIPMLETAYIVERTNTLERE